MNHSHQTPVSTPLAVQIAIQRGQSAAPSLHLRLLDAIGAWLHRASSRRYLASLDDRLLDDIGLTRSQVELESSKPFWRV